MRCYHCLTEAQPTVTAWDHIVGKYLEPAAAELLRKISEDEDVVECAAAQAYAVESGTLTRKMRYSGQNVNEPAMKACADDARRD